MLIHLRTSTLLTTGMALQTNGIQNSTRTKWQQLKLA